MENKNGFSLAEAMIMLTVISIIMAVSVPLIAKKTQVDTQTLFAHSTYNDGSNNYSVTSGGFGDYGRVGIGIKNAIAKLHVKDSKAEDDTSTVVFRAGGKNDSHAFKVYGNGSTNIRTCIPDYANASIPALQPVAGYSILGDPNFTYTSTEDGYLVFDSYCVSVANKAVYCPPVVLLNNTNDTTPTLLTSLTISTDVATPTKVRQAYSGRYIIPVSANDEVKALTAAQTPLGLNSFGTDLSVGTIPCATTPVK